MTETYQWKMKCVKCYLEHVVLSMFEDWPTVAGAAYGGPFCPECGSTAVGQIGTVVETETPTYALPEKGL